MTIHDRGDDPFELSPVIAALRTLDLDATAGDAGGAAAGDLAGDALLRARRHSLHRRTLSLAAASALAVVLVGAVLVAPSALRAAAHRPDAGDGLTAPDPWAGTPRVNVLLIGSDAAPDRTGIRPDSLVVASIDTATGGTVLVSLPRNLSHVPFPPGTPQAAAYPDGFYCPTRIPGSAGTRIVAMNTECLLNSLWTFGEDHRDTYYRDVAEPGLTATEEGVEQVTGLRIDQYVMLDLRGFEQFVDAIGGIDVTVSRRLPIGGSVEKPVATGGWIEAGRAHLDGYHALWFVRSRWSTSDYDRMARQRCVIGALVRQVDLARLVSSLPAMAAALKDNLRTSIPLSDLDRWGTLADRVRRAPLRSLLFNDRVIDPAHPDVAAMRALVRAAITTEHPTNSPTAAAESPTDARPASQEINAVC